eukprot:2158144-Prymnesium_polylepis.1
MAYDRHQPGHGRLADVLVGCGSANTDRTPAKTARIAPNEARTAQGGRREHAKRSNHATPHDPQ